MADIQFYQDENDDAQDDGDDSGLGIDDEDYGESYNPDEGLTPVQKLEKYINSDSLYSRQMVARTLLDTIRVVSASEVDCVQVLNAMMRLSDDCEPGVRTELMEQVPHIAMFCHENSHIFNQPIPNYILPIIVRYLMDAENQVRKTSQAALLVLMEQGLIFNVDIEEHVCPVIINLSNNDSIDDFRTEAVALMSKMAPVIGKELTVNIFMPRFADMCTDALFQVRKVCAANFGDMCSVVGQENTEEHLLPKFFYLCEDGVWGVRKACAECFMQVSLSVSAQVRHGELAQLFVGLLYDASRWVRMAAFTALGQFISTFADPSVTGLYFDDDGALTVGNPDDFKKEFDTSLDEVINYENNEDNCNKNADTKNELISSEDKANADNEVHETEYKGAKLEGNIQVDAIVLEEKKPPGDHKIDVAQNVELLEEKTTRKVTDKKTEANEVPTLDVVNNLIESVASDYDSTNKPKKTEMHLDLKSITDQLSSNKIEAELKKVSEETSPESFSSFLFWRDPLPDLDLDAELTPETESALETFSTFKNLQLSEELPEFSTVSSGGGENTSLNELHIEDLEEDNSFHSSSQTSEEDRKVLKIHTADVETVTHETEEVANIGSMHVLGQQVDQRTMTVVNGIVQDIPSSNFNYCPIDEGPVHEVNSDGEHVEHTIAQDVIPQALLDQYLSMTNPSRAQTVDAEIAKHCAYNLPAVAYTLGRKNWPCLRDLYEQLAGDMQWKVRRTLAFSIHELAVILGSEITCRDLVSVFDGFLRDLDEVRIGVLKHLAEFLKLLTPELRLNYLPRIKEFESTDNQRNWRFREDLSLQLILLLDLYLPEDISQHLTTVALDLSEDGVAAVRNQSFKVVAAMLKRFSMAENKQLPIAFVNDIIGKFAHNNRWNRRQYYIQICCSILEACALSEDRFATDMLPSLLALGKDKIPNVRITLAIVMSKHLLHSDYFTSAQNPHHEDLLSTIQQLKSDNDKDVRYFMSYPQTDISENNTIPV